MVPVMEDDMSDDKPINLGFPDPDEMGPSELVKVEVNRVELHFLTRVLPLMLELMSACATGRDKADYFTVTATHKTGAVANLAIMAGDSPHFQAALLLSSMSRAAAEGKELISLKVDDTGRWRLTTTARSEPIEEGSSPADILQRMYDRVVGRR